METKKLPLIQRITQGVIKRAGELATHLVDAEGRMVADVPHPNYMPADEGYANAELMEEAFNTTHESGMPPAKMWDRLQYVEGLMEKFERQEARFVTKCEEILTRISQMPLGKRLDENLDDAVLRVLEERQALLEGVVELLKYEGDTEWADTQRSWLHAAALKSLREAVAAMEPPQINPPLDCDRETLVAYLRGLQEGERVIEAGVSGMIGRKGTVYFSLQGEGDVCVRWDVLPGEDGQMGTSATGGTRRLSDVGLVEVAP